MELKYIDIVERNFSGCFKLDVELLRRNFKGFGCYQRQLRLNGNEIELKQRKMSQNSCKVEQKTRSL